MQLQRYDKRGLKTGLFLNMLCHISLCRGNEIYSYHSTNIIEKFYLCNEIDMKQRVRFIINPISGTHEKQTIVQMIPEHLPADLFETEVIYTEYGGHAEILAAEAAKQGMDICVAVGGDGTVNEVGRSLAHTDTALGIIPCGSGNGLARHLAIPTHPAEALNILAEGHIKTLDYGLINHKPFFCTCGIGFDALVSQKFAQSGKRGLLNYVDNTIKEGLNYKPETYQITIDGEDQTYEAFLIACANASQYGNNVYIAPAASMKDGLMDVTILKPFNLLEAPQVVLQLLNKTIYKNPNARVFRCSKLHVHRQKPGVVHFDGDPVECGTDIDVELIHNGIKVVVNAHKNRFPANPFLTPLSEVYANIQLRIGRLRETLSSDIHHTNERIRHINADLLNKLRDHKE